MSHQIVLNSLALQDNFNVTIHDVYFRVKFVTELTIVKTNQMSSFAMITHVYQSNSNAPLVSINCMEYRVLHISMEHLHTNLL